MKYKPVNPAVNQLYPIAVCLDGWLKIIVPAPENDALRLLIISVKENDAEHDVLFAALLKVHIDRDMISALAINDRQGRFYLVSLKIRSRIPAVDYRPRRHQRIFIGNILPAYKPYLRAVCISLGGVFIPVHHPPVIYHSFSLPLCLSLKIFPEYLMILALEPLDDLIRIICVVTVDALAIHRDPGGI